MAQGTTNGKVVHKSLPYDYGSLLRKKYLLQVLLKALLVWPMSSWFKSHSAAK